jgi:hypothetical protein
MRMVLPRPPVESDPAKARMKYFLVLQDQDRLGNARDIAGVICSTKRSPTRQARSHEVEVGIPEGFDHETIIDCRFPLSFEQSDVAGSRLLTTLSDQVMSEVNVALANGLQMI